ncbi:hypothetical protein DFH08DRAFT_972589 [Mycena albidolilacea]|uniref:Uncharacterized protein n=1 Tax=Mycena albidolilacea TaxID=1033008 RepID=A0AAD6ZBM0_9AGAR|nr:hypothetical protein DFH08DRAFT_972589 [Mycena albidolilacea]
MSLHRRRGAATPGRSVAQSKLPSFASASPSRSLRLVSFMCSLPLPSPSLYLNTSTSFLSSPLRARFLCCSSSLLHSSLIRSSILPSFAPRFAPYSSPPSTLLPLLPLFPLASDSSPPASSAPSSLSLVPFPLPLDADITSLPGGGLRPSPRGAQLEAE